MRKIAAGLAAASAVALAAGALAPAATAADGNKSLAAVLTSDGGKQFDSNHKDFDIVTEAVLAVLAAKPDSAVKVLTDGSVALTAFVPNDMAFMHLVHSLTGKMPSSEKKTFAAVAGLGIDTVETVLLYHVVPGATVDSKAALKSDEARLTTAQGGTFKVNVVKNHGSKQIRLQDQDRNARNPRVIAVDVNKGNVQIAHVIDRVLRPLDLPPTAK
jgi:uncharacterized surface protein with fasciclin (FAS1) repeats